MKKGQKKALAVAVVGTVALAAAGYLIYAKRSGDDGDEPELSFAKPPPNFVVAPSTSQTPAETSPTAVSSAPSGAALSTVVTVQKAETAVVVGDKPTVWKELSLSAVIPSDWKLLKQEEEEGEANDGPHVMWPLGVVRFGLSSASSAHDTSSPNVSLIAEDVSSEYVDLEQYVSKAKEQVNQQAAMMMMAKAEFPEDHACTIGPFQHRLLNNQLLPVHGMKFEQFSFLHLLAVKNGIGYLLQYIARTDLFYAHLPAVLGLAATVSIDDLDSSSWTPSSLLYTSAKGGFQISLPPNWTVAKRTQDSEALAQFEVPTLKAQLYRIVEGAPLEVLQGKKGGRIVDGQLKYDEDGVATTVVAHGQYALVIIGTADASAGGLLAGIKVGADVIRTVVPLLEGENDLPALQYSNKQFGLSFTPLLGSKLVEPRFGDCIVQYYPEIPPQTGDDEASNVPVCQIVQSDSEGCKTVEEVKAKVSETGGGASIKEQTFLEVAGTKWFAFTITDMRQTNPWEPASESKVKVIMTVRGERSYAIRWEVVSNRWSRYEGMLNNLLASFQWEA